MDQLDFQRSSSSLSQINPRRVTAEQTQFIINTLRDIGKFPDLVSTQEILTTCIDICNTHINTVDMLIEPEDQSSYEALVSAFADLLFSEEPQPEHISQLRALFYEKIRFSALVRYSSPKSRSQFTTQIIKDAANAAFASGLKKHSKQVANMFKDYLNQLAAPEDVDHASRTELAKSMYVALQLIDDYSQEKLRAEDSLLAAVVPADVEWVRNEIMRATDLDDWEGASIFNGLLNKGRSSQLGSKDLLPVKERRRLATAVLSPIFALAEATKQHDYRIELYRRAGVSDCLEYVEPETRNQIIDTCLLDLQGTDEDQFHTLRWLNKPIKAASVDQKQKIYQAVTQILLNLSVQKDAYRDSTRADNLSAAIEIVAITLIDLALSYPDWVSMQLKTLQEQIEQLKKAEGVDFSMHLQIEGVTGRVFQWITSKLLMAFNQQTGKDNSEAKVNLLALTDQLFEYFEANPSYNESLSFFIREKSFDTPVRLKALNSVINGWNYNRSIKSQSGSTVIKELMPLLAKLPPELSAKYLEWMKLIANTKVDQGVFADDRRLEQSSVGVELLLRLREEHRIIADNLLSMPANPGDTADLVEELLYGLNIKQIIFPPINWISGLIQYFKENDEEVWQKFCEHVYSFADRPEVSAMDIAQDFFDKNYKARVEEAQRQEDASKQN